MKTSLARAAWPASWVSLKSREVLMNTEEGITDEELDKLVAEADVDGDGQIDSYDTTGDGKIDSYDTTGDGHIDASRKSMREGTHPSLRKS